MKHNDNFPMGGLADAIVRQARAIEGKRRIRISDTAWRIAIGDQVERRFWVPYSCVINALDEMNVSPTLLMRLDSCQSILEGIGWKIADDLREDRKTNWPDSVSQL